MKQNYKIRQRLLTAFLVIILMLTFVACGSKEEQTGETKSVSKFDSGKGWPELADPLSW